MKTLCWIISAIILGLAFGSVSAKTRHTSWPIVSDLHELTEEEIGLAASMAANGEGTPELELETNEFHFGALDIGKTGSHDFIFTNVGDGEMRLTPGPTSCTCTSTLFKGETLPPGASERITVEWKAKEHPGEFTQTATIYTNDPQNARVVLNVTGRFTASVDSAPREIVFGNVMTGTERQGDFKLYCYEEEPLEILGYEVDDSEHFVADWTPLQKSALPEDATSGYEVTITVKPGLPVSTFSDKLRLETSSTAFSHYDVPIEGVITSNISLAGPRWDRSIGAARLDFIPSGKNFEHQLMVRTGNLRGEEITISVARSEPDWIEAELGEPISLGEGTGSLTPLIIRIPDDAPSCNFMGTNSETWGKIFLETSDPMSPVVRVLLRFAIGS